MKDKERKRDRRESINLEGDDDLGEGADAHKPFARMSNVYDKLLILGYSTEFVQQVKIRPIHRLYFMISTNPGEQFYNFVSIASWLLQKCGRNLEMPQESDDPNTVISGILESVRSLGGLVDFPPSKVKSGWGEDVVATLDFLSEKAVGTIKHEWAEAAFYEEEKEEPEEEEDDPELNLDKIEEEMENYYSSEGEDNDMAWVQGTSNSTGALLGGRGAEDQQILKSETDAEQWRLEVERVLPQLKITIKTDSQDWRWRQEQMKLHSNGISDILSHIEKPLERLVAEAANISDKVSNREKYLNTQFAKHLEDLSAAQEKLVTIRETHRQSSNEVSLRNKSLLHLNDELDQTRRSLDDRGSIMADGAPVISARKGLNTLKKELGDMEVEIGVMEHCVLKSLVQEQIILRDKTKNF